MAKSELLPNLGYDKSASARKRTADVEPLATSRAGSINPEAMKYAIDFIRSKMGLIDETTLDNALIVLGDRETIERRNVGPSTFSDLLADARSYYAVVHANYDPKSNIVTYFSGAASSDQSLKKVRFLVDFDREIGGERIVKVEFDGNDSNPKLKALEGLQLNGGFAIKKVD